MPELRRNRSRRRLALPPSLAAGPTFRPLAELLGRTSLAEASPPLNRARRLPLTVPEQTGRDALCVVVSDSLSEAKHFTKERIFVFVIRVSRGIDI